MSKYKFYYRQQLTKYFFTIDPGARADGGTGIACWKNDNDPQPLRTKQISSKLVSHSEKVDDILININAYIQGSIFTDCVALKEISVFVEKPQFFDSFKGITAARSDSLFKLINFYSRLEQIIRDMALKFVPLEINHWKGQLSKSQVSTRVERICGKSFYGDVTDAVGMGLFLKGLM